VCRQPVVAGLSLCGLVVALVPFLLAQSSSTPGEIRSYQPPGEVILEAQVWPKRHKRVKHLWVANLNGPFDSNDVLRQLPRPVLDLTANEFHVFDNGVEQTVNYFRQAGSAAADLLSDPWSFIPTHYGTWGALFRLPEPHFDFPPASYLIGYAAPALRPGECHAISISVEGREVVLNRNRYCAISTSEYENASNGTTLSTSPQTTKSRAGNPLEVSIQAFSFWSSGVLHVGAANSESGNPRTPTDDYSYSIEEHDSTVPAAVHLDIAFNQGLPMRYPCTANRPQLQVLITASTPSGEIARQVTANYSCLTFRWAIVFADPPNGLGGFYGTTGSAAQVLTPIRLDTQLDLVPGDYDIRVVVRNSYQSGPTRKSLHIEQSGQARTSLHVEPRDPNQLAISDVVISGVARSAEWVPRDAASVAPAPVIPTPLVSKGLEYLPDSEPVAPAARGTPLYVYFEIYEAQFRAQAGAVYYRWRVIDEKASSTVMNTGPMNAADWIVPGSAAIPIGLKVDVDKLQTGAYRLEIQASDSASRKSEWRAAKFKVQ
jgi:hypothetical protein